jgi:hypothetical protein
MKTLKPQRNCTFMNSASGLPHLSAMPPRRCSRMSPWVSKKYRDCESNTADRDAVHTDDTGMLTTSILGNRYGKYFQVSSSVLVPNPVDP